MRRANRHLPALLLMSGSPVAALAHTPVPCTAVVALPKIVDFPLHAGEYSVRISANAEPQTTVPVARAP